LGAAGILLLAAIFAFGNRLNSTINVALVIVAAALIVLAGFWSRVSGKVGITKEGFTIPIEAANRAEQQLERGEVVDADKLPELLENIRQEIRDASKARDSPSPEASPEAEGNTQ
jgi:hypothetical protein